MKSRLDEVDTKIQTLEKNAEDAENRSRRNNIRLVGIPEKLEKGRMLDFLESWLREQIAPEGLSQHYALERAHRVPARPPVAGAPPRPIVARLLHFRDHILAQARLKGDIRIGNSKVMVFPDYTREVQKKRASFQGVKKRLRQNGLTYGVLFPARLRVETDGGALFFESPTEASLWIDNHYSEDGRGPGGGGTTGGRRRRGSSRSPPTAVEALLERRRVVEVVASLSGGTAGSSLAEESQSRHATDSDRDSLQSVGSEVRLPVITPGTSDEIL